jgi:sec-independent protein translocase protein TatA
MFEGLLSPMHLVVILVIGLLVLGPKRLPEAGRGLGQAIRGFKASLTEPEPDEKAIDKPVLHKANDA